MSPAVLLYHLAELGARVALTPDLQSLEVYAPRGTLTPEMLELLREHKGELCDLLFEMAERDAIEWEGQPSWPAGVMLEGDPQLVESVRNHPAVRALLELGARLGGGTFEVVRSEALAA